MHYTTTNCLNILVKLNLHLVSLTKTAKRKIRRFTCRNLLAYVYIPVLQKELDLMYSEFLSGATIESENRRVKSFPQEYQSTFIIVQISMGVKNVVSLLQSNNSWKLQTYQMC